MSDIILPGDPPVGELKRQIAELHYAYQEARAYMQHVAGILLEVVAQHGINNAMRIGPRTMDGKPCKLAFLPSGDGIEIRIELPEDALATTSPSPLVTP